MDFCNSNDYSTFRNYQMKTAITYIIGIAMFCIGVQCIFYCGYYYAKAKDTQKLIRIDSTFYFKVDSLQKFVNENRGLVIDSASMARFMEKHSEH